MANLLAAHCTGIEARFRLRQGLGLNRQTAVVASVGSSFSLADGIEVGPLANSRACQPKKSKEVNRPPKIVSVNGNQSMECSFALPYLDVRAALRAGLVRSSNPRARIYAGLDLQ